MPSALSLPEGRAGQLLALCITLGLVCLVWFGAITPVIGWYQARQNQLATERTTEAHMEALANDLPALRRHITDIAAKFNDNRILLDGNTDAVAGANLQAELQSLASQSGLTLNSSAMLPVQQAGALRRVAVSVSVTAPWPTLIALLQAIDAAEPRMIVTDLGVTSSPQADPSQDQPLQANISIVAFSAVGAP
jgi:general secretion pathway protein M